MHVVKMVIAYLDGVDCTTHGYNIREWKASAIGHYDLRVPWWLNIDTLVSVCLHLCFSPFESC